MRTIAKARNGFHCIVIDPPWENKSVDRKTAYPTFYMKRLFQLPVCDFLCASETNDPCFTVVAIWVTNNPKITSFVRSELLSKWKLEYSTTWHWLKCTNNGELVCPLDTAHRKPYESAIIGIYNPHGLQVEGTDLSRSRLIISTPSTVQHSRKPNIQPLLGELCTSIISAPRIRKLELFARNLSADCVSWGNEVLHHQDRAFFDPQNQDQTHKPS